MMIQEQQEKERLEKEKEKELREKEIQMKNEDDEDEDDDVVIDKQNDVDKDQNKDNQPKKSPSIKETEEERRRKQKQQQKEEYEKFQREYDEKKLKKIEQIMERMQEQSNQQDNVKQQQEQNNTSPIIQTKSLYSNSIQSSTSSNPHAVIDLEAALLVHTFRRKKKKGDDTEQEEEEARKKERDDITDRILGSIYMENIPLALFYPTYIGNGPIVDQKLMRQNITNHPTLSTASFSRNTLNILSLIPKPYTNTRNQRIEGIIEDILKEKDQQRSQFLQSLQVKEEIIHLQNIGGGEQAKNEEQDWDWWNGESRLVKNNEYKGLNELQRLINSNEMIVMCDLEGRDLISKEDKKEKLEKDEQKIKKEKINKKNSDEKKKYDIKGKNDKQNNKINKIKQQSMRKRSSINEEEDNEEDDYDDEEEDQQKHEDESDYTYYSRILKEIELQGQEQDGEIQEYGDGQNPFMNETPNEKKRRLKRQERIRRRKERKERRLDRIQFLSSLTPDDRREWFLNWELEKIQFRLRVINKKLRDKNSVERENDDDEQQPTMQGKKKRKRGEDSESGSNNEESENNERYSQQNSDDEIVID
ncbi:MAG: hypothetical protein EZS28_009225 [Streblomastix strix]|uniref:Uncharacterized protein n=1 Tax=Streblomastix strix TaxID=222440 RepID=A0A5J4WL23_9EUKA|nr:MAG: hypothetical protein EZS28_009225 [Streblomastix strix]